MKRLIISALAATALAASAQINSSGADGFFARGIAMYNDRNYTGCIDQLSQLYNFTITPKQSEQAFYYLSLATLHAGDDEAIDLLREFLLLFPASERCQQVRMCCGDFYFTRGEYEEALKWYTSTTPEAFTETTAADLTYRKAYSYMLTGQNVMARPLFAQLMADREYGNAARFYQAYMAYEEKNYAEALKMFRDVNTDVAPGSAAPYYMAQIYFINEDYSKALDMALRMVNSNEVPQFTPEARRIAGESLYNMGHLEQALPYLWQYAQEAADPLPSTLYILGVSEYESGNYTNAIGIFQKAVNAGGKVGQGAWLYLGQAYMKTGNPDGALLAFEKAYSSGIDPSVTETAFYNYIASRTAGGRMPFSKTVDMLEDFLRRFPRSRYASTVQESLINGYMSDGDYQSALIALNRISKPSEAMEAARQRVLFELGSRELTAGNPLEASRMLRQAAEGPDSRIASLSRLWAADCDYANGDIDRAAEGYLDYASSASENDPNLTLAYYNLGYSRYKQGRYADALTDFRRVVNAHPETRMEADAFNRIADCLYQQRRFDEAAANYHRAYELNPSSGDYALYQLAVMRGLQDNRDLQISDLDNLISQFPSSSLAPAAMLDKAEAYTALGQTDKAIATYRSLVSEYESSSYGRQAYLQLAITQNNAGRTSDAIESYKKVIYTYPTSEEAKVAVDDLKQIFAAQGRMAELTTFLESVPNSPRLSPSELDALAFQAAENMYINTGNTSGLKGYLDDYPHGNHEAQALYYQAEAAADKADFETALDYATQVVLNHPDSEVADEAMLLKADTEARQGNGEIALNTYRSLENRAAGSRIITDARLGIMRTALALGRYSEVLVATDKLKASTAAGSADLPEIRFSEGMALDRLGRHDEAYSVWNDLASDPNNLFGARAAVSEAESMLAAGKTSDAERVINKFINANSPHHYWQARAFIVLSDVLRKKGNKFEADEYLRALRSNYPGTEPDIFKMIETRLGK